MYWKTAENSNTNNETSIKKIPGKTGDEIHIRKHRDFIIDLPGQHDSAHQEIDFDDVSEPVDHSFQIYK